jgi:hypothetical protein
LTPDAAMKNKRVSVFEAMNHARKEILVGVTALPIPELFQGQTANLPIEISHWEPAEEVTLRRLAEEMPVSDAWQFLDLYSFFIEQGDWRIIRQAPSDGDAS